jgi:hypothetical protein
MALAERRVEVVLDAVAGIDPTESKVASTLASS